MNLWLADLWVALWTAVYAQSDPETGYWLTESGDRWELENGSGYWTLEATD